MRWYMECTASLCFFLTVILDGTLALSANAQYRECCDKKKDTNDWCKRQLCTFNLNLAQALITYPVCSNFDNTMANIWQCARGNRDHTKCCRKK
uniref:Domain of unknown function DB domain-containing protein n=1 Tax=Setaria digitata TaxID=48799 RepID=A0A915Q2P8_9BILA